MGILKARYAALLFLCAAAFATAVTPEEFVQPFLEPGEYSVSHHVPLSGNEYYAVWVNASPTFVLREEGPTFVFINETSLIHAVLLQDFLSTVDIQSEINGLNASLKSFEATRAPHETDCAILTGTIDFPCIDEDTCLQACFSVPACRNYNMGSGGDLVREILAWRQQKALLDANISLYSGNLSIVASHSSQMNVAASSMASLLSRFDAPIEYISTVNKLFLTCPVCFGYCQPQQFDRAELAHSSTLLSTLSTKLAQISGLASQADAVQRETFARTQKSTFTLFIMRLESVTSRITARAEPVFMRARDAQAEYNLTRIRQIASQATAFGAQKEYFAAYALQAEFDAISDALDRRLGELEATLARYDGMMANVSADFLNVSANANNALAMMNDSRLSNSLSKMRNTSEKMVEFARQSRYADAFELQDDYYWESARANEFIMNISVAYAEISGMRENAIRLVTQSAEKLRADDFSFRSMQENLSRNLSSALTVSRPPIPAESAEEIKSALLAVSADATALSQLIDRAHAVGDRKAAYSQAARVFQQLFYNPSKVW